MEIAKQSPSISYGDNNIETRSSPTSISMILLSILAISLPPLLHISLMGISLSRDNTFFFLLIINSLVFLVALSSGLFSFGKATDHDFYHHDLYCDFVQQQPMLLRSYSTVGNNSNCTVIARGDGEHSQKKKVIREMRRSSSEGNDMISCSSNYTPKDGNNFRCEEVKWSPPISCSDEDMSIVNGDQKMDDEYYCHMTDEELNTRSERFIHRFHQQIRLQI